MNDLRDRIAQALADQVSTSDTIDAVMPIVNELAADLDHAERENRRLTAELANLKR